MKNSNNNVSNHSTKEQVQEETYIFVAATVPRKHKEVIRLYKYYIKQQQKKKKKKNQNKGCSGNFDNDF